MPLPIADPEFHDDPLQHTKPRVRKLAQLAIASLSSVRPSITTHILEY
jgi:hypothetical protein